MTLRDTFIDCMRSAANTVSVVTTNGTAGMHGATVTSFCSVSADPPMMLVCLHSDSRTAAIISENKQFCVNILPQGMESVSQLFAGRVGDDTKGKFDTIETTNIGEKGIAIDGATSFECTVREVSTSGSHIVFIGLVNECIKEHGKPLVYYEGEYVSVTG